MTHYSIGELARRTGLTVKTIRFYADRGVVPATERNAAGHRVFDEDAAARLELVRSLRELGIDLPTVRRIVEREVTVADVAAVHADALGATIRTLSFRRAVLTAIARRKPEETEFMHRLAALSEGERQRLVEDFLAATFADLDASFAGVRRSLTPELPDDPSPAQLDAWIELVALTQDPDFRVRLRELAEQHAADRPAGGVPRPEAVAVARATVPPAALGTPPDGPGADPVVAAAVTAYGRVLGEPDTPQLRRRLLDRLDLANDPRRYRYERLLAVVNGWLVEESLEPTITWLRQALHARMAPSPHAE